MGQTVRSLHSPRIKHGYQSLALGEGEGRGRGLNLEIGPRLGKGAGEARARRVVEIMVSKLGETGLRFCQGGASM